MGRVVMVAMLLFALPARAEWSRTNTSLEVAYAAAHLADWSQTIGIARAGTEGNPLLGRKPAEGTVHAYFAATLLLHAGVSYVLPRKYREVWQVVSIGVEFGTAMSNRTFGVRFALP